MNPEFDIRAASLSLDAAEAKLNQITASIRGGELNGREVHPISLDDSLEAYVTKGNDSWEDMGANPAVCSQLLSDFQKIQMDLRELKSNMPQSAEARELLNPRLAKLSQAASTTMVALFQLANYYSRQPSAEEKSQRALYVDLSKRFKLIGGMATDCVVAAPVPNDPIPVAQADAVLHHALAAIRSAHHEEPAKSAEAPLPLPRPGTKGMSLLDAIRSKPKLTAAKPSKAEEKPASAPEGRDALLAAIQGGVNLKKTDTITSAVRRERWTAARASAREEIAELDHRLSELADRCSELKKSSNLILEQGYRNRLSVHDISCKETLKSKLEGRDAEDRARIEAAWKTYHEQLPELEAAIARLTERQEELRREVEALNVKLGDHSEGHQQLMDIAARFTKRPQNHGAQDEVDDDDDSSTDWSE